MMLTDTSGNVQTQYTYGPFGNTLTSGASNDNPYKFGGREADPVAPGMYYLRARFLDSGLSRFVSRDPAGFQGSGHLYNYAGNAPTMATDPTGQFVFNGINVVNTATAVAAGLGNDGLVVASGGGGAGATSTDPNATGNPGAEGAGSSSDPSSGPSGTPSSSPTPYTQPAPNGGTLDCMPTGNPGQQNCPTLDIPPVLGGQPLPPQGGLVETPTGTVTATPTPGIPIPSGGQYPIF